MIIMCLNSSNLMIAFNDREYLKYAPFTYELIAYDAQQYLSKEKKILLR
jgi:hypothetical protein